MLPCLSLKCHLFGCLEGHGECVDINPSSGILKDNCHADMSSRKGCWLFPKNRRDLIENY